MRWSELRADHPEEWLIIEAVKARSDGGRRILDDASLVEVCSSGAAAFSRYRVLHHADPARELYFVHTSSEELEIEERPWTGIRWSDATLSAG